MIYLQRGSPDFWTRKRVKEWTARWLAKDCESDRWDWFQYDGKRLNHYACEAMEPWHYGKCAFCETPLSNNGEIEHFRSKTRHPLAAFIWRNLFLACQKCNQAKGSEDHEGCLKPDRENPTSYLWVNPISLRMEPKPGISSEAHQRAVRTIERYQLNRPELTRLYEAYLLTVSRDLLFPLVSLVAEAQERNLQAAKQIPLRLAGLQALAQPEQPFSLMVKSLLEYYQA